MEKGNVLALLTVLLTVIMAAQSLGDYYADTLWPTLHADSRNSDLAPVRG